jgi:hypothetical protein
MTATLHSFGLSFAPSMEPSADQRRAKADADAIQARRDALPVTLATWAERLSFGEMEALAAVERMYAANGKQPLTIPRAHLAEHLNTSPDDAEKLLHALTKAGAVTRLNQFYDLPLYTPVPAPPAPTRSAKSDSAAGRLRAGLGLSAR